jgi:hypothetical protein
MAVQVKLKDIIESLEFLTDEGTSYLNTTTGEVVYVTTEELRAAENDEPLEDFPDWQHDVIRMAKDIVETDHYLPLPDRFEIHEYSIMERFCLSVDDEDMRDDLCDASVVEEHFAGSKTGCSYMGWLKSGIGIVM